MIPFPQYKVSFPELPKSELNDRWYTLGSCFASNLGLSLQQKKLIAECNPAGNLYNPLSILEFLRWLKSNNSIADELFFHQDQWKHPLLHSSWNRKERPIEELNLFRKKQRALYQQCNRLILTFGNACVWKRNSVVYANCHRLPQQEFEHITLSTDSLIQEWKTWHKEAFSESPNRQYYLTLSPIRHFPKNPLKNSLSKSILRCFLEEFQSWKNCYYLPLYEVVHDQLRDYQYYEQDGIHLRPETTQYLLDRFLESTASSELKEYLGDYEQLQRFCNHQSKDFEHGTIVREKKRNFYEKWPSLK